MNNNVVIERTAGPFKPIIKTFLESDVGGRCRVVQVKRSSIIELKGRDNGVDRFVLTLPYSNSTLKCHIALNASQPQLPPDFVFENPFFLENCDQLAFRVPSLLKWNVKKPDALVNVASEFIEWYKDHHLQLLQDEVPDFYAEFVGLISEMNSQNIEPFVSWKETRFVGSVTIKLTLECSKVPTILETCRDSAGLKITYKDIPQPTKLVELYLSEELEDFFMGFPKAHRPDKLPALEKDQELFNYVTSIRISLQEKIDECCAILMKRKMFIFSCMSVVGDIFLHMEYDEEFYKKITFSKKDGDGFNYLVSIELPENFPTGAPVMIFHSLYASNMGRNLKLKCDDFPYSPDWKPGEIAKSFDNAFRIHKKKFRAEHVGK